VIKRKSWEEFRKSGMLFLTNTILQFFGWSIIFEYSDKKLTIYPARTKYRGFSEDCNDQGHKRVARYLKNNATELYDESGDTE
jgi:hypothetical protein